MSSAPARAKQSWRTEFRRRLRLLTPENRRRQSEQLCDRVAGLPAWRDADTLLLFHPLPGEPDVRPLLELLAGDGRQVALPSYQAGNRTYVARQILPQPGRDALVPGPLGILEPPDHAPLVAWNQLDFILIPGLGFAPGGRRLGRGKGYYDRLLAGAAGFRCGIGFDEQWADDLPTEPHDVLLDCLLTPSHGWLGPPART